MLRRFWEFARPCRGAYLAGFVLLVITNVLSLAIPWLLRDAIHAMERGAVRALLARYALAILVTALVQSWIRTLSRLKILGASRQIAYDVRNRFFTHLERLDARFYDTQRTGDIMSRGVNDLQLLQSFYGPGVMNLVNTVIVYVAVLVLLFRIDVVLTFAAVSVLPLLFLAVNRLSKRVYARSVAVQEQLGRISNRAQENLSGIQQVKIYAQEEREIAGFRALCSDFRQKNLALARARALMLSLISLASGFGTIVVLALGGLHVIQGKIGFGDFVAYNAYLALLAWPTVALGWTLNVFQRGAGALERIDEILSHEPRIPPPEEDGDVEPVDGTIEIRNLTFGYASGSTEDAGRHALEDVTLAIPRGSRVALVGPVGSGKSTLVSLLARIYAAPRGTIFLDGVDISDIPVARLRRSIGFVPQEAFLFSKTLRANILLGRPDAEEVELEGAVRLSGLAQDIGVLPQGLGTLVGERGYTLSGGQRQRATLARAAVGDPRILILDDSLSAVDADTERSILREIDATLGGRTCIFISHRLSTLAAMDRIVVLDRGRVVEDGTHEELLAREGLYARLFTRQLLEERLDAR